MGPRRAHPARKGLTLRRPGHFAHFAFLGRTRTLMDQLSALTVLEGQSLLRMDPRRALPVVKGLSPPAAEPFANGAMMVTLQTLLDIHFVQSVLKDQSHRQTNRRAYPVQQGLKWTVIG